MHFGEKNEIKSSLKNGKSEGAVTGSEPALHVGEESSRTNWPWILIIVIGFIWWELLCSLWFCFLWVFCFFLHLKPVSCTAIFYAGFLSIPSAYGSICFPLTSCLCWIVLSWSLHPDLTCSSMVHLWFGNGVPQLSGSIADSAVSIHFRCERYPGNTLNTLSWMNLDFVSSVIYTLEYFFPRVWSVSLVLI